MGAAHADHARSALGRDVGSVVACQSGATSGMSDQYEPIAISIREVARRLQIGKSTAHRLVTSGEIPGFLVGHTWRVLERDYQNYIDRKRAEAEEFYRRAGKAS